MKRLSTVRTAKKEISYSDFTKVVDSVKDFNRKNSLQALADLAKMLNLAKGIQHDISEVAGAYKDISGANNADNENGDSENMDTINQVRGLITEALINTNVAVPASEFLLEMGQAFDE